jgi:hypothetical protein
MAEITNVSKLIINYLTEDQYKTAKTSGLINENELYVTDVQDSTTLDCFEELFTATAGQTLFTLTEGTYQVGKSRLTVCVNGAQQPSTAYTETSPSSFTFDSGLSAGDSVIARYVNARIVSNINLEPHKTSHCSGGTDPLTPSDIGAANASHTHSADMIVDDASNRFVTDTEKAEWNGKANPPTAVTATLSTTWACSGPYTQSVTVSGVTSTNNITVSLASTADEAQRNAARDALLSATAQATNSITVTADGDKPIVALPIQVLILGG